MQGPQLGPLTGGPVLFYLTSCIPLISESMTRE